jgi:hypothetical protein
LRSHRYLLLIAILAFCTQLMAEPLKGIVVGIADGDTLTVLESYSQPEHYVNPTTLNL